MPLPLWLYLDHELNIIHLPECSGTKMARRYGYGEVVAVRTVEEARELDKRFRACDRCKDEIKRKATGERERKHRYRRNGQQQMGGMR